MNKQTLTYKDITKKQRNNVLSKNIFDINYFILKFHL